MKKLIFVVALISLSLLGQAQNDSVLIFDLSSHSAGDTVHYYDDNGLITTRGPMVVQIRFDSLDCDNAYFDAGQTLDYNGVPIYPVSYAEISFPQKLDTALTRPAPNTGQLLFSRYKTDGEHRWTFGLKYTWDRGQVVYTVMTGSCTRGRFWRLR